MFQAERSLTLVPTPALEFSSPLADSVLTLSRNTVRETSNIVVCSASRGSEFLPDSGRRRYRDR